MSMYVVVIIMNFFWFSLILKGLKRLLQEKGFLAMPKGQKVDETYLIGMGDASAEKK